MTDHVLTEDDQALIEECRQWGLLRLLIAVVLGLVFLWVYIKRADLILQEHPLGYLLKEPLGYWSVGLVGISLFIRFFFVSGFLLLFRVEYLAKRSPIARERLKHVPIPAFWIGAIEAIFFTVLVASEVSGAGVAMITWILAKMVVAWAGRTPHLSPAEVQDAVTKAMATNNAAANPGLTPDTLAASITKAARDRTEEESQWAYSSLLGCILSVLFALLGGLFIRACGG